MQNYLISETKGDVAGRPTIIRFLESKDYVNSIKLANFLGGDADNLAAVAGSMAYAYNKNMPDALVFQAIKNLMRIILAQFEPWNMQRNDKIHYFLFFFILLHVIRKKRIIFAARVSHMRTLL